MTRRAMERAELYLAGVSGDWQGRRLILTPAHPVTLTTRTHGSLHAYSALIGQHPYRDALVTGWWRPAWERSLSPRTAQTLDSPGPWVVVGFRSMPDHAAEHVLAVLNRALEQAGARAVVQGRGRDAVAGPLIHHIGDEPHRHLFCRVDAVVITAVRGRQAQLPTPGSRVLCGTWNASSVLQGCEERSPAHSFRDGR